MLRALNPRRSRSRSRSPGRGRGDSEKRSARAATRPTSRPTTRHSGGPTTSSTTRPSGGTIPTTKPVPTSGTMSSVVTGASEPVRVHPLGASEGAPSGHRPIARSKEDDTRRGLYQGTREGEERHVSSVSPPMQESMWKRPIDQDTEATGVPVPKRMRSVGRDDARMRTVDMSPESANSGASLASVTVASVGVVGGKSSDEANVAKKRANEEAAARKKAEEEDAKRAYSNSRKPSAAAPAADAGRDEQSKRAAESAAAEKKNEEEAAARQRAEDAAQKKKADAGAVAAKKAAEEQKGAGALLEKATKALQKADNARSEVRDLNSKSLKDLASLLNETENLTASIEADNALAEKKKPSDYSDETARSTAKDAVDKMSEAIRVLSEVQKEVIFMYEDRRKTYEKLNRAVETLNVTMEKEPHVKPDPKSITDAERIASDMGNLIESATSWYNKLNANDKNDRRDVSELIERGKVYTVALHETVNKNRNELERLVREATDAVKLEAQNAKKNLEAARKAQTADDARKAASSAKENADKADELMNNISYYDVNAKEAKASAENARKYAEQAHEAAAKKKAEEEAVVAKKRAEDEAAAAAKKNVEAAKAAEAAMNETARILTVIASLSDSAKKAETTEEAEEAARNASKERDRIVEYNNRFHNAGEISNAVDEANRLVEATELIAEKAHEEHKGAIEQAKLALDAVKGSLEKYNDRDPSERLVLIESHRKRLEATLRELGSTTPISKRIADETKRSSEKMLSDEKAEVERKIREQEERDRETDLAEIGTDGDTGLRFIISRTRHAISGAQKYKNDERYLTWVHHHITKSTKNERVGDLCGSIENVGALLYKNKKFVGVAVPVVLEEKHTTIIRQHEEHDSHELITASELQTASVLGYYKAYDPRTKQNSSAQLDLSVKFLSQMFVDGICNVDFEKSQDAMANFQKCLSVILNGEMSGVITERDVSKVDEMIVERTYYPNSSLKEKKTGFSALTTEQQWVDAIRTYKNRSDKDKPQFNKGTYVTPIGGYTDTRHFQFALLVHIRETDAIVVVASTDDLHRALVVKKTEVEVAKGVLDFALDISKGAREYDKVENAKKAILKACEYTAPGGRVERKNVIINDRYLAVSSFNYYDCTIESQYKRESGESLFYNTLWLLGIAYALKKDEGAVDFLVTPGAYKEEHSKEKAEALIGAISEVDKELKKLAFEGLYRTDEEGVGEIADLVATDYAGCTWLDTGRLRDALYGRSTGPGEDARLVTECTVFSDTPSNFRVRDRAEKLSDLSDWIETSGYLFDTSTDYVNGVAAIAHFIYIARDLLIKPVADLRLVTEKEEKKENESKKASRSILLVSAYLAYIKRRVKVYRDTVVGMQMRCVRYIAHIVKEEHGPRETRAHLHYRDIKNKAIMRCNITTSLPWVAAEYTAMQEEASEITDLVFESTNVHHLNRLYNPNHERTYTHRDNPDKGPAQVFLISANKFHETYLNDTKARIEETKRDIKSCDTPGHRYFTNNRDNNLSAFQENLRVYENEKEEMENVEVDDSEKSALSYIQSSYSLSVLNAVSALLKAGEVTKKVTRWVFGFGTGPKETRHMRNTRFCWSDLRETKGYNEHNNRGTSHHRDILQPFQALSNIPPKFAYDHIDANMEYLYNATRDCTAKKSTRAEESSDLKLTVMYPEPTIGQDIPSLVEWVDKMNETVDQCDYSERGIEYIILRHVVPLSAQGPTDNSIRKLGSMLARLVDKEKETHESPAMYEAKKALLGDMRILIEVAGTVPQNKLKESAFQRDHLTLNLLLSAYMTIASHKGKLADVLENQSNLVLSLRTNPSLSWSLTKLDLEANKGNGFVANEEGHKFVVSVQGDGVAKVHRSLMSASCKFDHWKISEEVSVIDTSDTRIQCTNAKITLEINRGNDTKDRPDDAKRAVFTGHCEWWGLLYGSAVIPIGEAKVTELVVIPGDYDESQKSTRFPMKPVGVDHDQSEATVRAYLGTLPTKSFVVTLDSAGLLPVASTETDELVRLFVAYAYAGSKLGTRLMQCVASRAIYDPRRVPVPGHADAMVHDAIRRTILGSRCPFGWYSAFSLVYTTEPRDFPRLQSLPKDLMGVLVGRLVSSAVHESDEPQKRAAFSFWAEYGEPERLVAYAIALEKETDPAKRDELERLKAHTDEWMTTLSATTGRFVRADQREKIGLIVKIPWSVVQMNMGFGKSSVIVPMLVARYICKPQTKIVFVTQPPHLVPQAARTVGALIAAHPYVRSSDGSVVAVRALNGNDMTTLISGWTTGIATYISRELDKYVVVLSTAELQCIVRDYPMIYDASGSIVHIADEVDAESDPLKCEVIIEGPDKKQHYNASVASNEKTIVQYYQAACDLVFGTEKESAESIEALDGICSKSELKAGTRLRNVYESIKQNMKYRVNFGMSDDPDKIAAVPYDYSGTPSRIRDFSDIDVAILVLVMSIDLGMRDSDTERLRVHIFGAYGENAESIMKRFSEEPVLMKRFYLMQMALLRIKMSTKENAVSFVDLLGMAGTLVGFSGTMGASIEAPKFSERDGRIRFSEYEVPTIEDEASNERVRLLITGAKFIFVHGDHGLDRAREVIKKIAEDVNEDTNEACIVDGSGEFGVFLDDVEELRGTWDTIEYFDAETGMRKRNEDKSKRTVLYYSHRNSRGTDSEMSETAIGRTIMSWETSRESDIAQAIFRLRKLDKGQKVVLVVVSKSELESKYKTGAAVLERLGQNERAYAESASDAKAVQMEHAAKPKHAKADFDRYVVYREVASVGAQKQQEQQAQNQALVQNEKQQTKALVKNPGLACYEKIRTFSDKYERDEYYAGGKHTLLNLVTETGIRNSLIKTKIGLSPMITDRDLLSREGVGIRRAFALRKRENSQNSQRESNSGADKVITVTVITIVEAWGKYKRHAADRYAYYTHDGQFIHGNEELKRDPDIEGAVLLGRYLCDEVLSISAEILLLEYLKKIYQEPKETDGLRAVLKCFYESGFITAKSMLLGKLVVEGNTAESILQGTKSRVDDFVNDAASGDKALRSVLEPIILRALGMDNGGLNNSFGKRKRRSISSFV